MALAFDLAWRAWDGRSFDEAVAQARTRAIAKAWTSETYQGSEGSRAHDLLALYLADGKDLPAAAASAQTYDTAARAMHERWLTALQSTWVRLQNDSGFTQSDIDAADADARAKKGTGAELPIIIIIVAILAVAALGAFLFYRGTDFVMATLAKYEQDREIVRLHEEAKAIYLEHAAREQAAGKSLPWNEYEMSILKQLEAGTKEVIRGGNLGVGGEQAGSGTAAVGGGLLVLLAILAAVAYFYFRKR